MFYFLVDEINELQSHGINLTFNDGKQFKITFLLGLVVRDNLEVNSVLDLQSHFHQIIFVVFVFLTKKVLKYLPMKVLT